MHIVITLAIVVNILSLIVLLIGLLCNFEPKAKAVYGYYIAGCMLMYLALLSFIGIYGLVINHNLYCLILFLCVISPFVIGKLVKYETLKKYTVVQLMCFVVSLVTLFVKF